jgi:hypothetical protein
MNISRKASKALVWAASILLLHFTIGGLAVAQTCLTPPAGLVSWWPGDGNADDIGDGNHGTLKNGTTFASGMVGEAFTFDGLDDFVLIEDRPNLNPADEITIDAWILVTDDSGDVGDIISKDGESFDRQYLLAVGIGTRRFRPHVGVPGGFAFFDGETTFQLNQWYHVAMTYDGSFLKLYVNGNLDGSLSVSGSIITTTQPVRIGGGAPPGESQIHFRGLIDEVEIANRAFSATEIQATFLAGSAGKCKPVPFAYLRGSGATANPSLLFLDITEPTATTAKYKDSPGLNFNNGNPWKEVGTWTDDSAAIVGTVHDLSNIRVWLGLKNTDDQGTQFDLRAEVWKNGEDLVTSGETLCITGLTRTPANAKQVIVPFTPFAPVEFNGTTDVLSLKVLTRIGTNLDSTKCSGPGGSHSSAVGLRLYFDAVKRASRLDSTFAQ